MIGTMDRKAVLLDNTVARDAEGGRIDCWKPYATIWVDVRWTGMKNVSLCGTERAYSTYVLQAWKRSDIAVGVRVSVDNLTLVVDAIDFGKAVSTKIVLYCSEVVP